MSGSNGRKQSLFSSWFSEGKAQKRRQIVKALRVETLERRNLMAGDVSPWHNDIVAQDVNADGRLTPLDALLVVNDLNVNGSRKISSQANGHFIDVNNDGNVTAIDSLMVVNALNSGEGIGEQVQFRYSFFDTTGNSLDPNPNDAVEEYQVGLGQRFIMRTTVQDLRGNPFYVYAAYHDVEMKNQDGGAAEIAALQWGEFNDLKFGNLARKGSFSIQYGEGANSQTTASISLVLKANGTLDTEQTAAAIRTAIGDLPFVGGINNVKVIYNSSLASNGNFNFGIYFVGSLARSNQPDPSIALTTLASNGGTFQDVSITGLTTLDPTTDKDVVAAALKFQFIEGGIEQFPSYINTQAGTYISPATGTYLLDEVGAFSKDTSQDPIPEPVKVFESTFIASREGTVLFSGKFASEDVLLLGEDTRVSESLILYPTNIPLKVVKNISAINDTFPTTGTILEDSAVVSLNVTQNDSIFVGTSFGVTAVTQPTSGGGSVAFTANAKTVNYTPAPDFFGQTTFTYTITNNVGDSATATVTVNVTAVNDAPVVIKSAFSVAEDTTLTVTPSEIFTPGPNEATQTLALTVASLAQTNGNVSIVAGNVVYQPTANFFGTALFTVTATDNGSPARNTTTTLTVTVTGVNDAPVPFTGSLSTNEDTNLILIGTGAPTNILTSSSPGPGETTQTVSLVSISSPTTQGGTITTVSGVTTYTPPANYFGPDTFTYTIRDSGNLEATATVTINVASVNDAPTAVNDSGAARFTAVGLTNIATTLDPRRNDSAGPNESTTDTIKIVAVGTTSRGGTVTIAADGLSVRYTPLNNPTNVNVEETFSYTIEDSGQLRSTAVATVFIVPPVLPFAVDDFATVAEDGAPITIDVLPNDLFNAGAKKELLGSNQPTSGSVAIDENGTPSDFSDDKFIYTPAADFFGTATFTYDMIDDAVGSVFSKGTVVVQVTEVNDVPVAVNKTVLGVEGTPSTYTGASIVSGLSKGPNEDSQTLSVVSAVAVSTTGGTVSVQNGDVLYTPSANFTGDFLFRYTVQDNGTTKGATDPKTSSATITIQVVPFNDPPIFVADSALTLNEDGTANVDVTTLVANDRPAPATALDEATQVVSFVSFTGSKATTAGGSVALAGNTLTYTPAANFFGQDTFVYSITDDGVPPATALATLTFNVTSVNDAPTPVALNKTAFKNLNRVLDLSSDIASTPAGPSNESSQTVRLTRVFAVTDTKGTVTLQPDGTVLYVPQTDFIGSDVFGYEVKDNGSPEGVATSVVNVDVKAFIPSKIKGNVFVDDNRSGSRDANELVMGGVSIVLRGRSVGENQDIAQRVYVTLADGSYHFDDLPPGAYTVTFVDPALISPNTLVQSTMAKIRSVIIATPGDVVSTGNDFSILGVRPGLSGVLENLASSYAQGANNLIQNGLVAAVDRNGVPLWSINRGGFSDSLYNEVVFADIGRGGFISRINAAHEIETAIIPLNRFVDIASGDGGRLIRILGAASDLNWSVTSLAAPRKSRNHLDSMDQIFAQETDW